MYERFKKKVTRHKVKGASRCWWPLSVPPAGITQYHTPGSEPHTLTTLPINAVSSEWVFQYFCISIFLPKAHEEVGPCLILTKQSFQVRVEKRHQPHKVPTTGRNGPEAREDQGQSMAPQVMPWRLRTPVRSSRNLRRIFKQRPLEHSRITVLLGTHKMIPDIKKETEDLMKFQLHSQQSPKTTGGVSGTHPASSFHAEKSLSESLTSSTKALMAPEATPFSQLERARDDQGGSLLPLSRSAQRHLFHSSRAHILLSRPL